MAVKVYGVRIEEHVIKDFKKSLDSLPVVLKSGVVIESYMRFISASIKEYNEKGTIDVHLKAGDHDFLFIKKDETDYLCINKVCTEVKREVF